MAKIAYKMIPVTPEVYKALEELKQKLGYSNFNEMLRQLSGRRKTDDFGCWKGKVWAADFMRDRIERL
ncbi:MAG: hypothetical protein V1787_03120 [Candidatus Micrarchaeota archaeon]